MNDNEDNKPPTWRPKYPLGSWEYFTKPADLSTTELLQGLEFTLFARWTEKRPDWANDLTALNIWLAQHNTKADSEDDDEGLRSSE